MKFIIDTTGSTIELQVLSADDLWINDTMKPIDFKHLNLFISFVNS